ncbi:calcium-binding protein [Variovorax sp. VNK109]|uniref:calcium-binding protein n=1 Tax=Variovorax sp. VNK109 TaxID=3400919 RepID=UPI003BFBD5A9
MSSLSISTILSVLETGSGIPLGFVPVPNESLNIPLSNQSSRIDYLAWFNPQTGELIISGTPAPVQFLNLPAQTQAENPGIFYDSPATLVDGQYVVAPRSVPVMQTRELIERLTASDESPYFGASVTFVGSGAVGLALAAASYQLRNDTESPVNVAGTVTVNAWQANWTPNGQVDPDVLSIRTPAPVNGDPMWLSGGSGGGIDLPVSTGNAQGAGAVVGAATQAFVQSVEAVFSGAASAFSGFRAWAVEKVVEWIGGEVKGPLSDAAGQAAAQHVDSPANIIHELGWRADLSPEQLLFVERNDISRGHWNVLDGKGPSGYGIDSVNYETSGVVRTTGTGANASQSQDAVQVTTHLDEATGAIMEVRLVGELVDGQFVASGAAPYVMGMDKAGRIVLPGLVLIGQGLDAVIDAMQKTFAMALDTMSPIVLDLDGDGVETVARSVGTHFDHNGDGLSELTGWVGADDGLLVRDINGNGLIDNGLELFGNNTRLNNGAKAQNGFKALAELDQNRDGKVDAGDAAFAELKVWKDADGDAHVDSGELLLLAYAGVSAIKLAYAEVNVKDAAGNNLGQWGSYVRSDGTTAKAIDVWFSQDSARTVDLNTVVVSDRIAALPELAGMGIVRSLHQTLARSPNSSLEQMLKDFARAEDQAERKRLIVSIVYEWTGVSGASPSSRGNYLSDARKLLAVEALLGVGFVQKSGTNGGTLDPGPNAAAQIETAFGEALTYFYGQLMLQTHFRPLLDAAKFSIDAKGAAINEAIAFNMLKQGFDQRFESHDGGQAARQWATDFDLALRSLGARGESLAKALRAHSDNTLDAFDRVLGAFGLEYLDGTEGADILYGTATADIIYGQAGADTLRGDLGDDRLEGEDGDDNLYGGGGNDVLVGGVGDDVLDGGAGRDTFIYAKGFGQDVLVQSEAYYSTRNDTAVFEDLTLIDLLNVTRQGVHLTFNFASGDSLKLQDFFVGGDSYRTNKIDRMEFADGTVLTPNEIVSLAVQLTNGDDVSTSSSLGNSEVYGLDGNDRLTGGGKSDRLDGGVGNDSLLGGAGNDVLIGGGGNDVLDGGGNSDIYLFDEGFGQDTIRNNESYFAVSSFDIAVFGCGIDANELWFRRVGNNLEASVIGTTDMVTIEGWYLSSSYHLDQFQTHDGQVLAESRVQNLVQAMAAFAPPAPGQTTLPPAYQSSLNAVIAANWQ